MPPVGKKIFTMHLEGSVTVTGTPYTKQNAFIARLMQEDIHIIGVNANAHGRPSSNINDGFAAIGCDVSQVGDYQVDGTLGTFHYGQGSNTAPASVWSQHSDLAVVFPAPGIPIKEEGYLYVNIATQGRSAGSEDLTLDVTVYYTKDHYRE